MIYNIIYHDKDGKKIMGRRIPGTRRIELEDGRVHSSTWVSSHMEYQGRIQSLEHPIVVDQKKFVRTINGFLVKVNTKSKNRAVAG